MFDVFIELGELVVVGLYFSFVVCDFLGEFFEEGLCFEGEVIDSAGVGIKLLQD